MTPTNENISPEELEFFKKVAPPFSKSKADVWAQMESQLEEPKQVKKVIPINPYKWAVAAAIFVLFGVALFMRFYTAEVVNGRGGHMAFVLPDGSSVKLNAESSISFHPYWWKFNRELRFEGEAFFEVKKGSNFAVISQKGSTEVVGTSFNINTRGKGYHVFCKTGKVRVTTANKKAELTPNRFVMLKPNEKNLLEGEANATTILGWMNNKFNFTAVSLNRVFEEIERQYDTEITSDIKDLYQWKYTGYFTKSQSADSTLNLICKSFGINFVKQDTKTYRIRQ